VSLVLKIAAGVTLGVVALGLLYGLAVDAQRDDVRERLNTVAEDARDRVDRLTATDVVKAETANDPVSLVADDPAEISVTLRITRLYDPYPTRLSDYVPAGRRIVAVRLRATNGAPAAFGGFITVDVRTTAGTKLEESVGVTGDCNASSGTGTLSTGDSASFCRVFEAGDEVDIGSVQASVGSSAPGMLVAEWPIVVGP
jgi:hypothetical protein